MCGHSSPGTVTPTQGSSGANLDDRLSLEPLAGVERSDGVVQGGNGSDVGAQPSVSYALDDLAQLIAVGLDDEVDRPAVRRLGLDRAYDGHQGASGLDQGRGGLLDVAADDVEDHVDLADVSQGVVLEVDELVRAEVEGFVPIGGASGADDVGADLGRELGDHRSDGADRAMREDALPRPDLAVDEQSLPRGQPRDRQGGADREVDVVRQGREVACLDRDVLREGAVAMPVREA